MSLMKPQETPPEDTFLIRCRRLGHQVNFVYCRREHEGLPCQLALDCWFPFFPIEELLRRELSAGEWRAAFEKPPAAKMVSLIELLEKARENTSEG